MGIYLFYSSSGKIVYVGKTEGGTNDLFKEINQRLKAKTVSKLYYMEGKTLKYKRREFGEIARQISAYALSDVSAIHNVEVLLLRAISNDTLNISSGNFRNE